MVKKRVVTTVAPQVATSDTAPAPAMEPLPESEPEQVPAEPEPPLSSPPAPEHREPAPPIMPRVASVTSDIRTLIFNTFVLLLVGILAPVVASQFWRNEVVIEAIAVPSQLQTLGLTPEVASARLVDALREVDEAGGSAIDAIDVVASTDRVDFSIPDSGLSIDSLVYYVRRFLKIEETRIGGEFRCSDADCTLAGVSLRLRVSTDGRHVLQIPPMLGASEDQYFYNAALEVTQVMRPVVAVAAIMDEQPKRAEVMARRIIRANTEETKWAHNLLGLIMIKGGENAVAIDEFNAALNIDPNFVPAKANLANALLLLDDDARKEEARQLFEDVQRAEPNNVRAAEGLADIASRDGDLDRATDLYYRATELEPTSTRYLFKAAQMQLRAGDQAAAVALLEETLEIDPSDPGALAQLGLLYYTVSDYAAAVPYLRNAADYMPNDADLQFQAGRAMLMAKDNQSAVDRLLAAVKLDPDNLQYRMELADAQGRSERLDEAEATLAAAAELSPGDPAVIYRQALNYQQQGRNDEARAAFQRVIDLGGSDAEMATLFIGSLETPAEAPAETEPPAE